MKQLKELMKKNTLLVFATCIALSSIVGGCNSCEQENNKVTIENNKVTIEITKAEKNIKGDEIGTFKLKKTEGDVKLGEVKMKFTNHADFRKEDGSEIKETIMLHEFLGKDEDEDEDEEMEDDIYEIKVKAADTTKTTNVDKTLKLAIGDEEKEDAFASETDVVTWEHTHPAALAVELKADSAGTTITGKYHILKYKSEIKKYWHYTTYYIWRYFTGLD